MAKYDKWLQDVLNAAKEVMKTLGKIEFSEAVYEEALCQELRIRRIPYERQRNFELIYKGYTVGSGRVDFIINPFWATKKSTDEHVMEIKAVKTVGKGHLQQAQVYMISLEIKTGAVMSFSYENGILVEPLIQTKSKQLVWVVAKAKSSKTKDFAGVFESAAKEVHEYFGMEFFYCEGQGAGLYISAMGVELRLRGMDFTSKTWPIIYKTQEIDGFKIPFVFKDGTSMALDFYKKADDIDDFKEYYKDYAKMVKIDKTFLVLIPQKEQDKIIVTEV